MRRHRILNRENIYLSQIHTEDIFCTLTVLPSASLFIFFVESGGCVHAPRFGMGQSAAETCFSYWG